MNRDQRRNPHAFSEQFPYAVPRRLGSDHRYVDVGGRLDLAEVDIETMRKHEGLALGQVRGNFVAIEVALNVVRHQDHAGIGGYYGLGDGKYFEAGGLRLGDALASRGKANDYVDAAVAEVERMRVPLAAVADDGNCFVGNRSDISVFFVVAFCH